MRGTSRLIRARLGYAAGFIVGAVGVGLVFGLGWALIVGGFTSSASWLILYDVDRAP